MLKQEVGWPDPAFVVEARLWSLIWFAMSYRSLMSAIVAEGISGNVENNVNQSFYPKRIEPIQQDSGRSGRKLTENKLHWYKAHLGILAEITNESS